MARTRRSGDSSTSCCRILSSELRSHGETPRVCPATGKATRLSTSKGKRARPGMGGKKERGAGAGERRAISGGSKCLTLLDLRLQLLRNLPIPNKCSREQGSRDPQRPYELRGYGRLTSITITLHNQVTGFLESVLRTVTRPGRSTLPPLPRPHSRLCQRRVRPAWVLRGLARQEGREGHIDRAGLVKTGRTK